MQQTASQLVPNLKTSVKNSGIASQVRPYFLQSELAAFAMIDPGATTLSASRSLPLKTLEGKKCTAHKADMPGSKGTAVLAHSLG